MAYNEALQERLEKITKTRKGFALKKMFGGIAFFLNGNMCFGIHKDYLVVRLDKEEGEKALKQKNTRPFDITGKKMKGWVMVESEGLKKEEALKKWVEQAIKFVKTMPKK